MPNSQRMSLTTAATFLLVGNLLMRVVIAAFLPITYKEAYFWEWSLFPSWGYLDHPPMIAWMIHLATMASNTVTPLVVRAVPLLLGTASLWLLFRLAEKLFNRDAACRAVIIAVCVPVLTATWMLALPDTALLFFQLLAFYLIVAIAEKDTPWRWAALGAVFGLAILSKLIILLTMVVAVTFVARERSVTVRRRDVGLTALIALVVSLPYWWWNGVHRWRALELQGWERHLQDFGFTFGKFGEVWFEQLAAASPLLLPLFVSVLFLPVERLPAGCRLPFRALRWQVVGVGGAVMAVGSIISQTHPHWTILAYPPAVLMLAATWSAQPDHSVVRRLPLFLKTLVGVGAVAVVVIAVTPQVVVHVQPQMLPPQLGRGLIKGKQRLLGYGGLREQLRQVAEEQGLGAEAQIFASSYHFGAPLSFALGQEPVICLDAYSRTAPLMGHAQAFYLRKHQIIGKSGLYIAPGDPKEIETNLRAVFARVTPLSPLEQVYAGQIVGRYTLYKVERYGEQ